MSEISFSRSQIDATAYAETPVNSVGTARSSAVCTAPVADGNGDYWQYVAYYDHDATVVLAKRKLYPTPGAWTTSRGPDGASAVSDNHNALSVGVDTNGIVHCTWGLQHAAQLNYWKGSSAGDISWTPPTAQTDTPVGVKTLPPANESTYGQFFNDPSDGTLYFSVRFGSSGTSEDLWSVYDVGGGTWTVIGNPVYDGEGVDSLYHNHTCIDANGRIHHAGCIRDTPSTTSNHDWLYYYSDDGGATWNNIEGDPITVPVTSGTKTECLAWSLRVNHGLMNTQGMTLWSPSPGVYWPVMGGYWDVNDDGISQYSIVWWNGTEWRRRQIGVETGVYAIHDDIDPTGTALSQPDLRWHDGKLYMFFRSEERGFGAVYVHTTGDFGATVETHTITMATGDRLIPMLDDNAWNFLGKACIYEQEVYADDPGADDSPVSILLLDLPTVTYAGTVSTYLKNKLLDHFRGIATYSRPATLYLALFNNGTELSGNNYSRVAVTNNSTNFPAATGRRKSLAVQQTFAEPSATWTVTEIRLMDASSNGNALFSCPITATVTPGLKLRIRPYEMAISFSSGAISDYLAHKLLDHAIGGGDFTTPANTYGAYFTAAPADGGTQLGSRVAMPSDNTQWVAASDGVSVNSAPISLTGQPSAAAFVEYDASSNGNLLVSSSEMHGQPSSGLFQVGSYSLSLRDAS